MSIVTGIPIDQDKLLLHIRAALRRHGCHLQLEPEDIFQTVFLRWLDPNRAGPRGDFLPWSKRVATNLIRDQQRNQAVVFEKRPRLCISDASRDAVERRVELESEIEALEAALTPKQRDLFRLKLRDRSSTEIMSALGYRSKKAVVDAWTKVLRRLRDWASSTLA